MSTQKNKHTDIAGLEFSVRLKSLKGKCYKNQKHLAQMVGVKQPAVSGWINGSMPKGDNGIVLAQKLGVDAGWLLKGIPSGSEEKHDANIQHFDELNKWRNKATELQKRFDHLRTGMQDLIDSSSDARLEALNVVRRGADRIRKQKGDST